MRSLQKRIRLYYWLATSFVRKNFKFIVLSFVIAFFGIVLIINFFPLFNAVLFSQKKIVGLVGQYSLQDPPAEIASLISSPLITINQKGEIQPVLANSYEILNDGRTYRFHLKTDLFWYDGTRFTSSNIYYKFPDVKIKPIDDYTIDFELKQPLTIFPIYLTKPVIKKPLVGIGALYKTQAVSSRKNYISSVSLTPNKPNNPFIVYNIYQTEDELVTAYKRGDITTFSTPNRSVAELFSSWKNTHIERVIDYTQIVSLFFNTTHPMLSDRDVRKGIALYLPPVQDYGVTAKSPILPTSWAYNDEVKGIQYNPEKAKTLLNKNVTASDSARLTLYTFYSFINQAEEIKKSLNNAGIDISLKIVSAPPESFDMFLAPWNPPNDPDQYFFWHSTQEGTNITKFNNAKVDKLLEDGRRIINTKQRKQIYEDFQKTIADEVPAVFLYHPYTFIITRK